MRRRNDSGRPDVSGSRYPRNRNSKARIALIVIAVISAENALPGRCHAMVVRQSIAGLARSSDLIAVCQIKSVRGLELFGTRRAVASVKEVWKGPAVESITISIRPDSFCDISAAKRGEVALLFLHKENDGTWAIENSGRGRMPSCSLEGKVYLKHNLDVSFPAETATVRTDGKEPEFSNAVEFGVVRRLVDKALCDRCAVNVDRCRSKSAFAIDRESNWRER
jgi:hypothetical protein